MGLRFRKSIKLGGLRINFSKSGIGYSYGVKGLRYTKTANGKDRITASIPGTGISYVEESARKKRKGSSTQPVVPVSSGSSFCAGETSLCSKEPTASAAAPYRKERAR